MRFLGAEDVGSIGMYSVQKTQEKLEQCNIISISQLYITSSCYDVQFLPNLPNLIHVPTFA
jgi:hypothetical protein